MTTGAYQSAHILSQRPEGSLEQTQIRIGYGFERRLVELAAGLILLSEPRY
jgi:hypothetical protein